MGEKQQSSLVHLSSPLEMSSKGNDSRLEISVQRPAFTQEGFDENYVYQRPKSKGCCHATQKCLSYEFSPARLKRGLKARLPIVDCFRSYTRDNIVGDVVAGLTVGIMQIPLGMAYAILGNCPAVTGLYTSFFPVLIYFFLGTSRHISQGTFAITSLMFGKAVKRLATKGLAVQAASNSSELGGNFTDFFSSTMAAPTTLASAEAAEGFSAIEVAASMCLIAGIMQIVFGFVRLGEVSIYMSDTLISGFTTGAAFLVFTSQFSSFFNIKVPTYEMPFEVVWIYKYVFEHFPQSNVPTMIVSVISLFVLAFTCEVINPWIMPKIKVPVPVELLAVVVGTGVSYAMDFKNTFKMKIVGEIPSGFPLPSVPPAGGLFVSVLGDSFAIALVTFIISFSVAKIVAKKHSYDINANQEFIAMGIANLASSFFSCFPMCVALSRTMVLDSVGGKTQIAGLLSCIVVLIVLVAIAPLFECLPNCVLAAIIVIGIRRMFLQFRDLAAAWKISKLEAMTWLVTFLAVVFIAIDIGLGIGVVFSLLTVVLRSQRPYVTTLGWVKETDLYVDVKKYVSAVEEAAVKIYHYGGPILFANSKAFRKRLYDVTGVNPRSVFKKMEKMKKNGRGTSSTTSTKSIVMIDMSDAKASIFENDSIIKTSGGNPDGSNRSMSGIQNPTFLSDNEGLGTYGTYAIRRSSVDGRLPVSDSVEDLNTRNASSFGSTDAICESKTSIDGLETDGRDVMVAIKEKLFFSHLKCLRAIIIDGSAISFVDFSGVAAILQVIEEYKKIDIDVYLAALPGPVLDMLESTDFYNKVSKDVVYPSVRDAVLHFQSRRKDVIRLETSSSSQL